jgi:hypothetical protein
MRHEKSGAEGPQFLEEWIGTYDEIGRFTLILAAASPS